jgi:hypothetical protein
LTFPVLRAAPRRDAGLGHLNPGVHPDVPLF